MVKWFMVCLVGLLLLPVVGCSGREPSDTIPVTPVITECEAIAVARLELPEAFADATTSSGLNKGTYFVNFKNINVTPEEIGWQEDSITHFYHENDKPWGQDQPENVYRNATVYVDAVTGKVTERELNNEIILGPIPPDCP